MKTKRTRRVFDPRQKIIAVLSSWTYRKTYYKWEQRGLSALLDGLSENDPGRSEKPQDPARAVLEKQMADLHKENRLLEQKMILKDIENA